MKRLRIAAHEIIRTPDGKNEIGQPLYKIVDCDDNDESDMIPFEKEMIDDISEILAPKFKQYIDMCEKMGVSPI